MKYLFIVPRNGIIMEYTEVVYNKDGSIYEVLAYNNVYDCYQLVEVFKTYFNKRMQEYYIAPSYVYED